MPQEVDNSIPRFGFRAAFYYYYYYSNSADPAIELRFVSKEVISLSERTATACMSLMFSILRNM